MDEEELTQNEDLKDGRVITKDCKNTGHKDCWTAEYRAAVSEKRKNQPRCKNASELTGKIKCAACDCNFRRATQPSATSETGKVYYWRCSEHGKDCQTVGLREDVLKEIIAEVMGGYDSEDFKNKVEKIVVRERNILELHMEQVCDMVDAFIEGGGTYFDTSYVYLGGRSEGIVREAVVKRYPRDAYTLTTKFPAQLVTEESQIAGIFEEQLTNCGVDYFDYYLLHTVQNTTYDPYVVPLGMFEFFEEEKERGRVKKLGFSFHGSPELLNRILTDYPEIDVVQIVVNYYDWESYFVRSRECYEIIRQHGKQVLVMQPVKGGMLADVPEPVRKMMEEAQPGLSPTAWALQYAAGLDGVLAVLSGMSTVGQVKENISLFKNARPLTPIETSILRQAVPVMKTSGPLHRSDFSIYEGISQNGMPVAGILDAYNSCMIQADPSFGAENAYYKNYRYDAGIPAGQSWVDGKLIDKEGNDITDLVRKAEEWLLENTY